MTMDQLGIQKFYSYKIKITFFTFLVSCKYVWYNFIKDVVSISLENWGQGVRMRLGG